MIEKVSKAGIFDSILILQQYKLVLMARFVEIKSINPKLKQFEIAKELGCSISSSQILRIDINRLSPYRILLNSNKRRQKNSNLEIDLERPQKTSNDVKRIVSKN